MTNNDIVIIYILRGKFKMQHRLKKSVVIFSDQPLYFSGLNSIIDDSGILYAKDVISNIDELKSSLTNPLAYIVIVDISLTSKLGELINILGIIYSYCANTHIFGLCERDWRNEIPSHLTKMFNGYLCKTMNPVEIRDTLNAKLKNNVLNFSSLHNLGDYSNRLKNVLSPREKVVLDCLYCGMTVTQISGQLNRSIKTISTQKRSAMRKLGIKSDSEIYRLINLLPSLVLSNVTND